MIRGKLLKDTFPDVAAQWNHDKNTTPLDKVTRASQKKYWWICSKGHSWEATPKNRTTRGSGCPYCSGRKATNETSIKVTFPQFYDAMMRFGDQEVKPTSLKKTSRKIVHLECAHGHTWMSSPHKSHGLSDESLCPYCSNREVLTGYNDLETLFPHVAALWDTQRNQQAADNTLVTYIHEGSKQNWICDKGHMWNDYISAMIKHPVCPVCTNRKIIIGINDISVYNPRLYQELHKKHKNAKELSTIFPNSSKKLTWICPQGHGEYQQAMSKRTAGSGCPVCAGNTCVSGVNDCATLFPKLAQEWDYVKNGDISPTDVSAKNAQKKYWWLCPQGHSYDMSPSHRAVGLNCPYCSGRRVLKGFNDLLSKFPDVAAEWDYIKNNKNPDEVTSKSGYKAWWVCEKGHSWRTSIDHRTLGLNGCPQCQASTYVSRGEKQVADFIGSILTDDITVRTSVRNIIGGKELDIYIPEKNIAIEYNGLYWHSDKIHDNKWYHYDKWKACKDKHIQLITIWEDDWRDRQDIVKSMLKHKLGVDDNKRVYARKTHVTTITSIQARTFLNKHHIQGFTQGSVYYGLVDNSTDELIAVSVWRKNKNVLYLDRYATSCTVVGGMGKLLKVGIQYARDNHLIQIITFSDHEVSDGGLYDKLGFTLDKELAPDYRYIYNDTRQHKFGFRKTRFKNDPDLLYEPDLTEKQLAELNNIPRVYDYGKTRWVMEVN